MATTDPLTNEGNSSATGMFTGSTGKNEMDKEAFLKLLVTQFQHQDPLNPMEDKEFIAQLAQFSSLEQQMATNETMNKLYDSQQTQQVISAASYIGREVSARGYGVSVVNNKETDKAAISILQFSLPSAAKSVVFDLYDESGELMDTVDLGRQAAGVHDFPWDGLLPNGSKAPDGVYTVRPVAKDAAGTPIVMDTSVTGVVKGITQYNGEQILTLTDNRRVALNFVREVMDSSKNVTDPKPEEKPEEDPKPTPHDPTDDGSDDDTETTTP